MKRRIISVLVLCLSIFGASLRVHAMNSGFSTVEPTEKFKRSIAENIELSLVSEDDQKEGITCFNISNDGMIALGIKGSSGDSDHRKIYIYDSAGKFQYGYKFKCRQRFGVQWDNKNIIIYLVLSDAAILIDNQGNILEVKKIENTMENDAYWRKCVFIRKRTVDDTEYTVENNMGILNLVAVSYSQLTVTDADGNKTVIYDMNQFQLGKYITWIFGIGVFIAIPAFTVMKRSPFIKAILSNQKNR